MLLLIVETGESLQKKLIESSKFDLKSSCLVTNNFTYDEVRKMRTLKVSFCIKEFAKCFISVFPSRRQFSFFSVLQFPLVRKNVGILMQCKPSSFSPIFPIIGKCHIEWPSAYYTI